MEKRQEDLKQALNKPKEIDEILEEQIQTALKEHRRSGLDLFLSAVSAGLEVGFSVFLLGTIYTLFHDQMTPSSLHLALAVSYPLGFIFVVIGRSELFTEHTTLAVLPVFNRVASIKSLAILWGLVYSGNLVGGYFFSYLMTILPTSMGIISKEALFSLALHMVEYKWGQILGSGMLAGWLMGLLSWLLASSQETISRIFIVILVTTVIGIGSLHHSIVGSIEVFAGMIISKEINFANYLHFQVWTTLGNIIGGVVFVALIKYSYIRPRKQD